MEFGGDATHQLVTPGISFFCERGPLAFHFECARNFGHQRVKWWDRNQVVNSGSIYQSHLFFVSTSTSGVDFTDPDFSSNGVLGPDHSDCNAD